MICRQAYVGVLIAVLLALSLCAGAAFANGHAKPGVAGTAYLGAGRTAGGPPASTARFSLEFVDADVVDVVQALANQSGTNIVASGSVTGKTSLRLHNVTLEQALNIVTKVNGLDYAWVDAAYVVGTPEEVRAMKVAELRSSVVVLQHISPQYAQEAVSKLTPDVTVSTQKGVSSVLLLGPEASLAKAERVLAEIDVPPPARRPYAQVVPVRYLKADQLASMIQASVPECVIQPGPQDNSLLITANEAQWDTIKTVVTETDQKPTGAQTVIQMYTVKYAVPTELQKSLTDLLPDLQVTLAPRSSTPIVQKPKTGGGEDLAVIQMGGASSGGGGGSKGGGTGVQVEAAPVTDLVLAGAPWTIERAMQMLAQLDKAPRQLHISAMVTEVNRDDLTRLGIDWFGLGAGAGFTFGEPFERDEKGKPDPTIARELTVGHIMRTPIQWSATFHALEEKGEARILSNPSVRCLDGRQTALHTGDTILYSRLVAFNNGTPVYSVEELEVGITLYVNPRVNDDGEITLTMAPSVSAVSGWVNGLPTVTERTCVSTVKVKNGETAVIAGLVSSEERKSVTKIPFLGDVPVLGELFKFRRNSPSHTEVLIFVTPTLVDG